MFGVRYGGCDKNRGRHWAGNRPTAVRNFALPCLLAPVGMSADAQQNHQQGGERPGVAYLCATAGAVCWHEPGVGSHCLPD